MAEKKEYKVQAKLREGRGKNDARRAFNTGIGWTLPGIGLCVRYITFVDVMSHRHRCVPTYQRAH